MNKRRVSAIGLAMLSAAVFSGCGGWKLNTSLGDTYLMTIGEGELLRSEAMLVVMDYKGQYEKYDMDLAGQDFWNETDKDGRTYGDIVKNDFIWEELTALTALNGMAVRDGVTLTPQEEERAKEAGKAYFETLNEAERDYTGASEDTAISLMKKYKTAEKEIARCSEGKDLEVSDEETRVMEIQVIYLTDENQANQAYERISSGEDFETVAQELSQDPQISYTVSRGELNPSVEHAVFQLESGEISPIIKAEQDFYIVKCQNDFDTALSAENRTRILDRKEYQIWENDLSQYVSEYPVYLNEWSWNPIQLEYVDGVENDQLYSVYQEYMQE